MADASRYRRAVWLRAERAFGLDAVPRPRIPPPPAAAAVRAQTTVAAPAKAVTPAPAKPATLAPLFVETVDFTTPPLSREQKIAALAAMNENEVRGCTLCRLCQTRTQTVFGEGDPDAQIFFIGEGPGETEDLKGRPFVGRAGELLNKMIAGMGLKREDVFIANIVKCRPPSNRVPAPDEVETCTPYLVRQLHIVRPRVIVTLGLPAAKYMLESNLTMGKLRGQWQSWRGIRLMPTFHPAYLLRSYTEQNRAAVWSDLKQVMAELGLATPKRST